MSEREDRVKARVKTLAAQARALFHEATRTSTGRQFWTYDHNATPPPPDWLQPLCMDAHGAGGSSMSADDFRYRFIVEALDALSGDTFDDIDEAELEADEHTAQLAEWLGSHGYRPGYCDEAAEEQRDGMASDTGIVTRLMIGQQAEKREVMDSVRDSLRAVAEAEEEADDDDTEPSDDDQEEADEPEEEDLITSDHITFFQQGEVGKGPAFTVQEGENWQDAAARWMNANQFYPSVWWISDHSNAHRMSMTDDDRDPPFEGMQEHPLA